MRINQNKLSDDRTILRTTEMKQNNEKRLGPLTPPIKPGANPRGSRPPIPTYQIFLLDIHHFSPHN